MAKPAHRPWAQGPPMHTRSFALLALAAMLAAGCSGHQVKGRQSTQEGQGAGSVEGIVVNSAILPLAEVHLTLDGAAGTVTSAEGRFAFRDVAPGEHELRATRAGYHGAVLRVAAGTPAKLVMVPDQAALAYVQTYVFNGFIEQSANVGVTRHSEGDYYVTYDLEGRPAWVQSELAWEASGLEKTLDFTAVALSGEVSNKVLGHVVGMSPLALAVDGPTIRSSGLEGSAGYHLQVYSGGEEPIDDFAFGVAVNQQFKVVTQVFHGFTPPPGYLFSKDGEPTPPA
ncbi:MAG TPA: carboxypeptidase-like regulatory domain-containing protein [Candidatus Thermoplasmatota archaeon]|nr:carboxypeptidase-like regulatory domain-containing protein [Candidatus Thermoplasmatota archaeon]